MENKKDKMAAALRYQHGYRCLTYLRRSIFSNTILAKDNKPTLIDEDTVEVKTVDQTVSISKSRDYIIINVLISVVWSPRYVWSASRAEEKVCTHLHPSTECNAVRY